MDRRAGPLDAQLDAASGIDDGGRVRVLVADQARGVRETIQVELFQQHAHSLG